MLYLCNVLSVVVWAIQQINSLSKKRNSNKVSTIFKAQIDCLNKSLGQSYCSQGQNSQSNERFQQFWPSLNRRDPNPGQYRRNVNLLRH